MEANCIRCHQTVEEGNTFCPSCGLPQLVYNADPTTAPGQADRWSDVARDASMVDWKPAMRAAFLLAIPAGLLSSASSPLSFFGIFWVAGAAASAVALYVRSGQSTAWITMGAGARIGLVTGLIAAWLAFTVSGGALFVERNMLHNGAQIDGEWKNDIEKSQQMTSDWMSGFATADTVRANQVQAQQRGIWMATPWGHAGWVAFGAAFYSFLLVLFAVSGGALGARLLARMRRPQL